jgi:hypothetical protein
MPTIFYSTTYFIYKKTQSILFYVSRLLPCNKPFCSSMMPIVIANNKLFWFVRHDFQKWINMCVGFNTNYITNMTA